VSTKMGSCLSNDNVSERRSGVNVNTNSNGATGDRDSRNRKVTQNGGTRTESTLSAEQEASSSSAVSHYAIQLALTQGNELIHFL